MRTFIRTSLGLGVLAFLLAACNMATAPEGPSDDTLIGALSDPAVTENFAYVPNADDATVSKLNLAADPPAAVARYSTVPDGHEAAAAIDWRVSRLAIDAGGNAWVLNSGTGEGVGALQGSVVRIAADGGEPGVSTSGGHEHVLPFDVEVRTTLFDVGEPGDMPRTINIAADGTIWIGFYRGNYFQSFTYEGGELLEGGRIDVTGFTPYLAALYPNGTMYVVSRDASPFGSDGVPAVFSFDTTDLAAGWDDLIYELPPDAPDNASANPYGIIIDDDGNVWVSDAGTPWDSERARYLSRWDGTPWEHFDVGGSAHRGLMQASDGSIWVADTSGDVMRLDPASGDSERFDVGVSEALGLGEDAFGNIWVVDHGNDEIVRIIPGSGYVRDAVVGVGLGPYAYGDFVVVEVTVGDIEGYKALTADLATVYEIRGVEEPLAGWEIKLYEDVEGVRGERIAEVFTDEDGYFLFEGVDEGTCFVCENVQDGTFQLEPADCHFVEVVAGETTTVEVDGTDYAFLNDTDLEAETAWGGHHESDSDKHLTFDGNNWALYFELAKGDDEVTVDLIAGQHYLVGSVTVARDNGDLDVTFDLVDGVLLGLVHFHVADDYDGLPQNRPGNPQIGHFDYQSDTWAIADETTSYDFTVEGVGDGDLTIAAHAEVWIVDDEEVIDLRTE